MKVHFDLTGVRVNRLQVIRRVDNVGKQPAWMCLCDCGNEKRVLGMHLRAGNIVDCGCTFRARQAVVKTTHGGSRTAAYHIWRGMRERCENPNHPSWHRYGGRGIKVCAAWADYAVFIADMGPRPSTKHSLDRTNNDGNYEPGNCRWATALEQGNNRGTNVHITLDGVTKSMSDWARHFRISYAVVQMRRSEGLQGAELFTKRTRREYHRTITYNGESLTLTQWAKKLNAPYITVWQRVNLSGRNPDGSQANF